MSTTSVCKDIWIKKLEFVTKTYFLEPIFKMNKNVKKIYTGICYFFNNIFVDIRPYN